MIVKDNTKLK